VRYSNVTVSVKNTSIELLNYKFKENNGFYRIPGPSADGKAYAYFRANNAGIAYANFSVTWKQGEEVRWANYTILISS
jgi:hypothetical protein